MATASYFGGVNSTRAIPGIHHVTAIASDPSRNLSFYTETLGLRLLKRTVNHDDPGTWHLYFGDAAGTPGTVLTFFPHPNARPGRAGNGMVVATALTVDRDALAWWADRLRDRGVEVDEIATRLDGQRFLPFRDPDGLALELVPTADETRGEPWEGSEVPVERAIRGFHGVTLGLADAEPAARFLTGTLGLRESARSGNRTRLAAADRAPGAYVDLLHRPGGSPGRIATGTVHHVAWRAGDTDSQARWRERVAAAGTDPSAVVDRHYFRSFYFRAPGGVHFEFATEGPGMTRDEPADALGERLVLPPWLEDRREEIEARLPPLEGG